MERINDGEYAITITGDPEKQKLIWEKLHYVTMKQMIGMQFLINSEAKEYKSLKFKFRFTAFIICWFLGTFIAGAYHVIPNFFNNFYLQVFVNSVFYGAILYALFNIVKYFYFHRTTVETKEKIKEMKETGKYQETLNKMLDFLSKFRLTKRNKKFFQFIKTLEENNELMNASVSACIEMLVLNFFQFNHEDGGLGQETWERYRDHVKYVKEKSPEAYQKLFDEAEEELKKVVTVYNADSEEYKRIFEIMSEDASVKAFVLELFYNGLLTKEVLEDSDFHVVFTTTDTEEMEAKGLSYDTFMEECEFLPACELTEDRYQISMKFNKKVEE